MDDKPNVPDFEAYYAQVSEQLPKASGYLQDHNIPMETAQAMNLGFYDPEAMPEAKRILMELTGFDPCEGPTLIIPYDETYWVGLEMNTGAIKRPKVSADARKAILGWGDLCTTDRPIWLAADALEVLALKSVGAAVYTADTIGRKEAREILKAHPSRYAVIFMPNSTTAYPAMEERAADMFRDGIPAQAVHIPEGWEGGAWNTLLNDPEGLRAFVESTEAEIKDGKTTDRQREDMAAIGYSAQSFLDRMRTADPIDATPTGLEFLDDKLDGGLYPGLYVLGAMSSMGKTSFILQIADKISEDGRDVLFFTIEQSPDELIAKSFSRITWEYATLDGMEGVSPRKILRGAPRWTGHDSEMLDMAARRYEDMARHLWIIDRDPARKSEGRGEGDRIGLDTIQKAIQDHITATGNRPVVFIDYLQILYSADAGTKSDKQRMDETVSELRRISKSYGGIPIFTISSLNRAAYNGMIGMDAFKESGAIEYSADVILAIQPRDLKDKGKDKEDENQKAYIELESLMQRPLMLHVMKNRMGRTGQIPIIFDVDYGSFRCDPSESGLIR